MDISERLIRIKAIVKELEQLCAQASPMKKDLYFKPFTHLYAEVGQGLIEADRLGNTEADNVEIMVNSWIADFNWEGHL